MPQLSGIKGCSSVQPGQPGSASPLRRCAAATPRAPPRLCLQEIVVGAGVHQHGQLGAGVALGQLSGVVVLRRRGLPPLAQVPSKRLQRAGPRRHGGAAGALGGKPLGLQSGADARPSGNEGRRRFVASSGSSWAWQPEQHACCVGVAARSSSACLLPWCPHLVTPGHLGGVADGRKGGDGFVGRRVLQRNGQRTVAAHGVAHDAGLRGRGRVGWLRGWVGEEGDRGPLRRRMRLTHTAACARAGLCRFGQANLHLHECEAALQLLWLPAPAGVSQTRQPTQVQTQRKHTQHTACTLTLPKSSSGAVAAITAGSSRVMYEYMRYRCHLGAVASR